MSMLGYIFLALGIDEQIPIAEQKQIIEKYCKHAGAAVDEFFVEQGAGMKRPFVERREGGALFKGVKQGDTIVVMKSAWVLGSAREGSRMLKILARKGVSMICLDLAGDIALPLERKLEVSEGISSLVAKILQALALCDSSQHGESIRAAKKQQKQMGKYLGGPVPFGWRVDEQGFFEQDQDQQKIIVEMTAMRNDRWSYRDIAEKLYGNYKIKLSHEGIRRILAGNSAKKKIAEERLVLRQ